MSEENKTAPIKALFSKLTEMIIGSCRSGKDMADMLVIVGSWASILFATLIVMLTEQKEESAFDIADRVTNSLNHEIKKHIVMIRGIAKNAKVKEEKRIITRDDIVG